MSTRNVLVIGIDAETYSRLAPLLERDAFEVDRFPGASGALELLASVAFRALIVGYPLAATQDQLLLGDFLPRLRMPGSVNLGTPLVLVSAPEHLAEAQTYLGRGANRALSIAETDDRLLSEVSDLLAVAPRAALREMLRLELKLGDERTLILCQTENVSPTGMLVRTEKRFAVGTELAFELTISGDSRAVRGRAQVVRHTLGGRDMVSGMGLRFIGFEGDGHNRFAKAVLRR